VGEEVKGSSEKIIGRVFQILTVLYMVMIFYLSHQPSLPQPEAFKDVPSIDRVEHIIEFFILGLLMFLSFHFSGNREMRRSAWMLALLGTVIYACVDEVHQMFVPGRFPEIIDLLADSTGAVLACFLGVWYSQRDPGQKKGAFIKLSKKMMDSEE
jgi:VanZ family protein